MKMPVSSSGRPLTPPEEIPFTPAMPVVKVAVILALLTGLIYFPVLDHHFVNYDDETFTTNNPQVAPGLTWAGVKWAFTSTEIDYWRPLSWLSHMVDFELYGAAAGLHHLTSVLIHMGAAVFLLLALHRMTADLWPSALVAALFAWHPLHVESVAWIAERKDVLCGFFWFYTLWEYARYVEQPKVGRYVRVLLGFGLGAMSKPMIVTLPCTLLLLDYWPLRRVSPAKLFQWRDAAWRAELRTAWHLLKEKLPMFALIFAVSLSTFSAQREVGTMQETIPLSAKLVHATTAYAVYLRQTFWPVDLCVLYPLGRATDFTWRWFLGVVLGVGFTVRLMSGAARFPFLPVGWLWFLGTLVPVVGLVQVGEQAHADRYTYVPLVGVFVMLAWGGKALVEARATLGRGLRAGAFVALVVCGLVAHQQLRYWENSVELFKRAIMVNPANATAHNNVGGELMNLGQHSEAIPYLERAIALDRRAGSVWNLGMCHFHCGHDAQAQALVAEAFRAEPNRRQTDEWLHLMRIQVIPEERRSANHKLLALASAVLRDYLAAAAELREAIQLQPTDVNARIDQAAYLAAAGRDAEAMASLEEAIKLAPSHPLARSNYASMLVRKGRSEEAISHYRVALNLAPNNPDTRHNYALLLARLHRPLEAREEFETVLRLQPNHQPALQQLAWLLATHAECRDPGRALILAKKALTAQTTFMTLDVAAAATAVNGNYQGASQLATEALRLAREANATASEDAIRARLQLYQAGQAYTQPSPQK